uniref:GPI ethanolamine phosphate transferase 2 n=1 Tax=Macrostomum lignano TaxID=282301 RepID=A0A1I8J442_9PLAT
MSNQNNHYLSSDWHLDRRCFGRKTVLLLIDGMRQDMVFSSDRQSAAKMRFLDSARRGKSRIAGIRGNYSAVVKVQSPTVTLPRIKCLTTGRVPGFLDVLWNFFASELATDSIVRRWHSANFSVQFYGDDTWTRMFLGSFAMAQGLPSFFATDFYEVDKNVTENLREALNATSSWDVLILHYLGLDHIGHIEGPNSRLVPDKLAEMDAVVESIVTALSSQPVDWLLVVTSDHGMSDLGGHGGASPAETRTPLVLLSSVQLSSSLDPSIELPELEQTDMANLLTSWTGVQPPRASLGLLHPSLGGLACGGFSNSLLSNNWLDLLELEAELNSKSEAFNRSERSKRCAEDLNYCYSEARQAQQALVYASAEYSLPRMLIGLGLGCLCCLFRLPTLLQAVGMMTAKSNGPNEFQSADDRHFD